MKQNVGSMDRNVRLVLGAILAVVGITGYAGLAPLAWIGIGQALASVIVVALGVILLATGLARTCLLYQLLGMTTAGEGRRERTA